MKVSIIFHSVAGNTYLMAKEFYDNFQEKGIDVGIYRVKDDRLESIAKKFQPAAEYLDEILEVPIIDSQTVLQSDYIFLGSPTYFGNVSSNMKAFMDSLAKYWTEAKLFGKKLGAFSSSATSEGGGQVCLQCINTFGQHLGMIPIPVPANLVPDREHPAYGLLHYSGHRADERVGEDIKKAIANYVDLIVEKRF